MEFLTKQEVHNRAKEAVGKTIKELNDGFSVSETKSSVGDALKIGLGKVKIVRVDLIWKRQVLN